MTKDAKLKRVVRRHAQETGQRYTEALTDLEELEARMHHVHRPVGAQLMVHLRQRYGIEAAAATLLGAHHPYVFRIDRKDGDPWVARAFPPARPRAGAEGDAAILRFLDRHDFPAERLAVDDAVSDFDGSSVLVTRFVEHRPFPDPTKKWGSMADLLGRLHALPLDESVDRPGGAEGGSDSSREGSPRQDLLAALSFLDSVDTKVAPTERVEFEALREQVRTAGAGEALPEALVHGNLLHNPDHVLLADAGVVAINWKGAGRGPRLSDLAWLMWGTHRDPAAVNAIATAYRSHVDLTDAEFDQFEEVMQVRPLYLACLVYRRNVLLDRDEDVRRYSDPDYVGFTAAAARAAFGKRAGSRAKRSAPPASPSPRATIAAASPDKERQQ
ncbi:MAG: phosphotransferase enzyme family protein [Acidimicrobiales bacterium]